MMFALIPSPFSKLITPAQVTVHAYKQERPESEASGYSHLVYRYSRSKDCRECTEYIHVHMYIHVYVMCKGWTQTIRGFRRAKLAMRNTFPCAKHRFEKMWSPRKTF